MTPHAPRIRSIFLAAVESVEPEHWAKYLDEQCEGDAELRRQVEMLLQAHQQANSLLDAPPVATLGEPPVPEGAGDVIGPYKLLQQLGEGGMGVVWMAEQTQPVQRKVALKVIKPGMDSRQVIARFEAERQALAMMDHVNIARVFDGGTTENGRPYFVMELVHGIPITKYCDDNRLTPRERLELFVPVCQAIQHAHQKGIIHRDIKPSNVMITLYDGKPVPKVIDFGVAKATEQKLTERTLFTQYGTMVGTLEYMSPEQAEMSALGVDTRSDIYSLGVLLYELLTGSTPLTHKRMKEAAYAEILRMIKEEEPPKPSTRLSDSGEALASISANRDMEPAKLTKLVRGELDWIVMKTLEKDRERRYETANGLAHDIENYLHDEPVQACPPSKGYRVKKFLKRNKGPVLAVAVVLLALLGGIIGTTWGLLRTERAREAEAERAEGERKATREALAAVQAEKKAKETAEEREAETRAVLDFVEDKIFAAARPEGQEGGLGHDVTLRQAVEAARPFVDTSFTNQPLVEARLRLALGISFSYLGEDKSAAEEHEKARRLYTKHRGPDHPDTLRCMNDLAIFYAHLGRHADALKLNEEMLALQKVKLPPGHPDTLRCMNNLALIYFALGRHADALKLREETLALAQAKFGPNDPNTLRCMHNLANSYAALGRHTDALKLREETLALRKVKLPPDHPDTLTSMTNLASSYADLGRHADALKFREEALALMKARLPPAHPDTLRCMNSLANSYAALGWHTDALKLLEETLALMKARLPPAHPDTLRCMNDLANNYAVLGRHTDALKLNEETLPLMKTRLGPDHPDTLGCMNDLAIRYAHLHQNTDALKLFEETLARRKVKLPPDHPDTLTSMNNLANSYAALGRHTDALKLYEETLPLRKAKLGPDHPDTLTSMHNLAFCYAALDRHADALKPYEETLALMKAKHPPAHPDTLRCMTNLADSYAALGRHTDALKLREDMLALRKAKLGPDHPDTLRSMWGVAVGLLNLDRGREAVPIIDECVQRAAGRKDVHPELIPRMMDLRLRHYEKTRDAAGCRATAELWEKLERTDTASLYDAACMCAVAAAVTRASDKSAGAAKDADADADRAMAWLRKAIAAGFKNVEHMKKDRDLDALRDRADFKELLAGLQAGKEKEKKSP